MDSAVIPLERHNLSLVQSVDFFYPLIDDPEMMGRIAFANMASDVYATGVVTLDKVTMICSCPEAFSDQERDVVIPLLIRGFRAAGEEAGCRVSVGGIAVNPWCMLGGVATSICTPDEIILPTNASPGDVLVLTKPLGTQLATNAFHWMLDGAESWKKLQEHVTEEDIRKTYKKAIDSMAFLNKSAAELMHKHSAHAATDVTGFGLSGHAENLLKFQSNSSLKFVIQTLPIIENVRKMAEILGRQRKLLAGEAVETSGGLLIALPEVSAKAFCRDFEDKTARDAWIVGFVESSSAPCFEILDDCRIIDV